MITNILSRKTCAQCKYCCSYTDEDLWDAPGFTKEEFQELSKSYNFPNILRNNLYYIKMSKNETDEYTCPLLTSKGCQLDTNKPFKCAIWPLYVIYYENQVAIAVSDICPEISKISDNIILQGITGLIPTIKQIIQKHPELIEKYRKEFRIICYL